MTINDISVDIDTIIESKSNFSVIAGVVGLDPRTDFMGMDLSGVNFANSDLREFNFSGSILDGCNLSRCRVSASTLDGVLSLRGAKLPATHRAVPDYVTVSAHLPLQVIESLRRKYGSVRQAMMASIITARLTEEEKLRLVADEMLMSGALIADDEYKLVSNKLPRIHHEALALTAASLNFPLVTTSGLLLMLADPSFIRQLNSSKQAVAISHSFADDAHSVPPR